MKLTLAISLMAALATIASTAAIEKHANYVSLPKHYGLVVSGDVTEINRLRVRYYNCKSPYYIFPIHAE